MGLRLLEEGLEAGRLLAEGLEALSLVRLRRLRGLGLGGEGPFQPGPEGEEPGLGLLQGPGVGEGGEPFP